MPDINTPPAPYVPDPTKTPLDNLYEIFYRRSTATPAEVEYYNLHRPAGWEAWDTPGDKPAAEKKQEEAVRRT